MEIRNITATAKSNKPNPAEDEFIQKGYAAAPLLLIRFLSRILPAVSAYDNMKQKLGRNLTCIHSVILS